MQGFVFVVMVVMLPKGVVGEFMARIFKVQPAAVK
jgi:hypothetical protein